MELKSDLSKVKLGDWVLILKDGWCQVTGINSAYITTDGGDCYPLDGKGGEETGFRDKYPTCFPADQVPKCFLEIYGPPPVEFEKNEPVWVSDEGVNWKVALFINRDEDGTYWVYDTVNTSHYSSGRKGYKYCRKITDEL